MEQQMTSYRESSCQIIPRSFHLTENETYLFDLLLNFKKNSDEPIAKTELRVVGGWVRDKLLGRPCDDIDIALSNVTGKVFLEYFKKWPGSQNFNIGNFGVIRQNPLKSKHLETSTMTFNNFSLDFVNLRSEKYTEDSRIPSEMDFGTPQSDAYRRDFTINSLFYFLDKDYVEDWTGRGLSDLNEKRLSTPLAPLQTFLDDPLRLLRAIRFASTLGFQFDAELLYASKNSSVREKLRNNISLERIGTELDKMLTYGDPAKSLSLICNDVSIDDILFDFSPTNLSFFECIRHGLKIVEKVCASLTVVEEDSCTFVLDSFSNSLSLKVSRYIRCFLAYAAFFYPLSLKDFSPTYSKGKKQNSKVFSILMHRLKKKKKDIHRLFTLYKQFEFCFDRILKLHAAVNFWTNILKAWTVDPYSMKSLDAPLLNVSEDFLNCPQVHIGLLLRWETEKYWQASLFLTFIIHEIFWKENYQRAMQEIYTMTLSMDSLSIFSPPRLDGFELQKKLKRKPQSMNIAKLLHYETQLLLKKPTITTDELLDTLNTYHDTL
ncbi:uncharacterized protein LOC128883447 [Hylaeus volcanicus]|uniref:uncharacterized protein LOC128883447 n=1 Tax=Hylaeus volcanicus TaxID=313075 RepID=UPI0023B78E68|nr:uncharacterized protein LOC128883447 [Hylaeus volcanicus]